MTVDSRDIVYRILLETETTGCFAGDVLETALRKNQFQDKRIRAFVTRLTEGVVERKLTLDFLIRHFSKTPFGKLKSEIITILRMGIYQILYMDSVPDRAAVSEMVRLTEEHGMKGLTGYVNAVLRAVIKAREENRINGMLCSSREVRYSTPEWLADFIVKNYGREKADKILSSQFIDRPTSIRVNECRISTDELARLFDEQGIKTERGKLSPRALKIEEYDFIKKLPGYGKGFFSVQDESSMYAVERLAETALTDSEGLVVLELCASPGGKSLYMAELIGDRGTVTARDLTETKTDMIRENAERLGLTNVEIQKRDALIYDEEMSGRADIVIADVPCSGLGVMGHKNDIKYNVTPESMKSLSEMGRIILKNASGYVKNGGTLMFSTCTINPGENEEVVHGFLEDKDESEGFSLVEEKTFLQGVDECDGFYYAILRKKV